MVYPPGLPPNMPVIPALDPAPLIVGNNEMIHAGVDDVMLNAADLAILQAPRLAGPWTAPAVRLLARHYRLAELPAAAPVAENNTFARVLFLGPNE